jgi:hypothetical protein
MNMKKYFYTFILLISAVTLSAQDKKLKISGFSEILVQSRFGSPAERWQLDSVLADNEPDEIFERTSRILIPAINLTFLNELSEKIIVLGEFFYQPQEGMELELVRLNVDYRVNPKFNIKAGKFMSPIGHLNRNQRFYGYLNNSLEPREMVDEEFGYIPLFTLGLQAHGQFDNASGTSFVKYMAAWGTSRHENESESGDITLAKLNGAAKPGFSGLVEYNLITDKAEISVGFSGFLNPEINAIYLRNGQAFVPGVDIRATASLRESGIAPYVRLNSNKIQFLGEYHRSTFYDRARITGRETWLYSAGSFELMYKTSLKDKPFGPYVRFDFREVQGNHPFFGLNDNPDGSVHKSFVPRHSELMLGFVWDIFPGNRVKLEHGLNFAGPSPKGFLGASTSFAF